MDCSFNDFWCLTASQIIMKLWQIETSTEQAKTNNQAVLSAPGTTISDITGDRETR